MADEGSVEVRPHGRGFAAEGLGFYVWDEDRSEVLRVARELERGNWGVPAPRRMVLLPAGTRRSRRLADPEALDA